MKCFRFRAGALAPAVGVALLLAGPFTAVAWGDSAIFGFQIGSVSADPLFNFANQGTAAVGDDTLTSTSPATVDLSVDLGPSHQTFNDALFAFDATLFDVQVASFNGQNAYQLFFAGSFEFKQQGSGNSIMQVAFSQAQMLMLATGGIVSFNAGVGANAQVTYTAGPALPGVSFFGNQEFSFTCTNLEDLLGGPVNVQGTQFEDFVFNSSFSGSAEFVPEPGTLLLLGGAVLAALRRRPR